MSTRRQFIKFIGLPILGANSHFLYAQTNYDRRPPKNLIDASEIIGNVTGNTALVNIVGSTRNEYIIKWGTSPDPTKFRRELKLEGRGSMTAELRKLKREIRYYYQVGIRQPGQVGYNYSPVHSFITQRRPGSGFSIVLLADGHLVGNVGRSKHWDNLAQSVELAAAEDIDFVVFLGDEVCIDGSGARESSERVTSNQAETKARYALWRQIYAPLLASKPAFLALGNHDGEAGFYAVEKREDATFYWQRWGTVARKKYILNPRHNTYSEGGENEGWVGPQDDPAFGGAGEGNRSPLENYYAWSWGDALFVVLDPFRYSIERPNDPLMWTLGESQLEWLETILSESKRKHKFIIAHHLVGGAPWSADTTKPGGYGRGGAEFSHLGEQEIIHQLMKRHGAQFFLYGHDHIFRASKRDNINYICCGRHGSTSKRWWGNVGWREIYGDDFDALVGYTLIDVKPDSVRVRYKISGSTTKANMKWEGRTYRVTGDLKVRVETPVIDVIRIWGTNDAKKRDLFRGGSFKGRTIKLGRKPFDGSDEVNVIYVGQESYKKRFLIRRAPGHLRNGS